MLTFNAAEFVRDAIESVLMQKTNFVTRLIIGDDNSTDGTQNILQEYLNLYPGVIELHLHKVRGKGVSGRVNTIHNMSRCTGKYVAMLDGDDKWLSDTKLQRPSRLFRKQ